MYMSMVSYNGQTIRYKSSAMREVLAMWGMAVIYWSMDCYM